MPRKQKEVAPATVEQVTEQIQELAVEKPKRARKTKIAETLPEVIPPAPVKQKRAPSKWVSALKQYNEGKNGYIIPKKGTPEYEAVRALMG